MNGLWDILTVAIGVSFIFMILSILNSWIQELISTQLGLRTKNLANVLQNMLEPDAKKLNGLLRVKKAYSDSDAGMHLLSGLEDTAKKVLKRSDGAQKYYPVDENLDILEQPAMGANVLGKVPGNKTIEPTDEIENDEGIWVSFNFKIKDKEQPAWLPKEKLKPVEIYRPNVDKVNVRKEASVNSDFLGSKDVKDVIESMGEEENYEGVWVKFLFKEDEKDQGRMAWVNKQYLRKQGRDDTGTNTFEQWERGARNVVERLRDNPVKFFYEHPIVHSLSKPDELPDHLPTKDFAVALLDALDDAGRSGGGKKKTSDTIDMDNIRKGIHQLDNSLADRLRSLMYTAQLQSENGIADLESFQTAVAEWFDDTVTRGKVWYKRNMQRVGIICGLVLAILLNADTIGISNALWHNAVLRESISQAAEASAQQGQPTGEQRRSSNWRN